MKIPGGSSAAGRWATAAAWGGIVLVLSSDAFAGAETGRWLRDVLGRLWPGASGAVLEGLHASLRKGAHVAEYLVFAVLLARALEIRPMGPSRAASGAVAIAAAFALLDEARQGLTASRVPALGDSLLDAAGAVLGAMLWLRFRRPGASARGCLTPQ